VLCCAVLQSLQLSGLRVLSSLAAGAAEGELPGEVLVPTSLLDRLLDLIRSSDTYQEVRGQDRIAGGWCCTQQGGVLRCAGIVAGCRPVLTAVELAWPAVWCWSGVCACV
jgi:hypothetical protein